MAALNGSPALSLSLARARAFVPFSWRNGTALARRRDPTNWVARGTGGRVDGSVADGNFNNAPVADVSGQI